MRSMRSHLTSFRIAAVSVLLAACPLAVQGQGTGVPSPPLPDLVLEGPVESGTDWKSQTWTVNNLGPASSNTSSLQVTCEVLYITPNSKTKCLGGQKSIPPLQMKTGSYSAGVGCCYVDLGSAGQTAPKYRLRITAKVDPSNSIKEVNDLPASNQKVVLVENFSGPPPSASLATDLGGVLKQGGSRSSSSGSRKDGSPTGEFAPAGTPPPLSKAPATLKLSTDKPYQAGQTVWILAKNVGSVDSVPAKVKVTCVWLAGNWANKECGFASIKSRELSVPALSVGQFQAIGQYGGLVNDCYFQWADVPAGGLACIGTVSDDIPPAHKATLDLLGVFGQNLILQAN
jgi:hypothetical protein